MNKEIKETTEAAPCNIDSVSTSYEYGIMSNKFSLKASNKLTAYATMCLHYQSNSHMIAIYEPEECKEDSWMNITGQISERLDEVFGGKDSFDKYLENNPKDIKECYGSIKKIAG
jgi:hypothetical protein